jgi:hypothetical protein
VKRTEYAAPMGLGFILDCGSTKIPRRWRCYRFILSAVAVLSGDSRN